MCRHIWDCHRTLTEELEYHKMPRRLVKIGDLTGILFTGLDALFIYEGERAVGWMRLADDLRLSEMLVARDRWDHVTETHQIRLM